MSSASMMISRAAQGFSFGIDGANQTSTRSLGRFGNVLLMSDGWNMTSAPVKDFTCSVSCLASSFAWVV